MRRGVDFDSLSSASESASSAKGNDGERGGRERREVTWGGGGGDAIEKLDHELNRLLFYQAELGMSGNVSWMRIMR